LYAQCIGVRETVITAANQTQVPADLRAKYRLGPGDVVVWEEEAGGVVVRFRPRHRPEDLVGAFGGGRGGNAVADKKRAQRAGR